MLQTHVPARAPDLWPLLSAPLREALVTRDRKTVYRIDDGIPVLLAEEGIATAQIADFPKA